MKSSKNRIQKVAAVALVLLWMLVSYGQGEAAAQQRGGSGQPEVTASQTELPENPTPVNAQSLGQSGTSSSQQDGSQKPVGTAAAPYERTMGVAASRPAGAAIAPAKQRRVRTIFISVGVIAGAAIAVGSVAALSHGSPSRP